MSLPRLLLVFAVFSGGCMVDVTGAPCRTTTDCPDLQHCVGSEKCELGTDVATGGGTGGGSLTTGGGAGGGGSVDAGSSPDASIDDGGEDAGVADAGENDAGAALDAGTTTDAGSDAGVRPDAGVDAGVVGNPMLDGPFAITEIDGVMAFQGNNIAIHVAMPTSAGSFPAAVFAHDFFLSSQLYYGTVRRLATYGYVAMTVEYPATTSSNNNPLSAQILVGAVAWAATDGRVANKIDVTRIAMSGHGLGGKLALLTSTLDAGVTAVFAVDPIDGSGGTGCLTPNCVFVKNLLGGVHIPIGFIGETLDSSVPLGQACAPASDNYAAFYAQANSPSLRTTALGAGHLSFLDNVSACSVCAGLCQSPTAPNAQVVAMTRTFMVAFFERYVRGITSYDTWLTGPAAQAIYVDAGLATITSK